MPHDDSSLFIGAEIRGIKKNLPIYFEIVNEMLDYKYTIVVHNMNWDKLNKHRFLFDNDRIKVEIDVEGNTGGTRVNPEIILSYKNHPVYENGVIMVFDWMAAGMCKLDTKLLEGIRDGLKRGGKKLSEEAAKLFWRGDKK